MFCRSSVAKRHLVWTRLVSSRFVSRNVYEELHHRSVQNPQGFWSEAAAEISWVRKWHTVLEKTKAPFYRWFPGGQLNMCYNAVDRHVDSGSGGNTALIYDSPLAGVKKRFTFEQLKNEVAKVAGCLAQKGIGRGDRVIIYMPMMPEAVFAMLACARLGAVHSVVFGGFAGPELATRIRDAEPKAVIWASCGLEPKGPIAYQPMLKEAFEILSWKPAVSLCKQRPELAATLTDDLDWDEEVPKAAPADCVPVEATDPLYVLYTSGSTGTPKGGARYRWLCCGFEKLHDEFHEDLPRRSLLGSVRHWLGSGAFLHCLRSIAARMWDCTLRGKACGSCTPDAGAFWRVIQEYSVRSLFAAPTALRAIRRVDPEGELIRQHDLSSLRNLFVAGERCDPGTSEFFATTLKTGFFDNWWQTETGHPICGLQDEAIGRKDGSTSLPAYGFDVLVVDDHGRPTTANTPGSLLVRLPLPPGTFPTLWKNDAGFVKSYMETYPGYFYTGDAGVIDQDGYVTVLERNDDIINVAAHRLSCGQIEAAIKAHPDVNDCAVVGAADPIKGQVPLALLVLNDGLSRDPEDIVKEVKEKVRHDIGAIASLAGATVVEQLPKTRSGKVLRKNIRGMADGKLPPIPGTIENPPALDLALEGLKRMGFAKGL